MSAAATVVAATAALLRWTHRRGGPATCLVQVRTLRAGALELGGGDELVTAVVVSELRGNLRGREIGSDFAGLATAALSHLLPAATAPNGVVWYAQHGEFSSYDPAGPATLTRIPLRWSTDHYQDPALVEHDLLDPERRARTVAALDLEPVAELLDRWGWSGELAGDGAALPG